VVGRKDIEKIEEEAIAKYRAALADNSEADKTAGFVKGVGEGLVLYDVEAGVEDFKASIQSLDVKLQKGRDRGYSDEFWEGARDGLIKVHVLLFGDIKKVEKEKMKILGLFNP
jgi:hypothetical protein